MDDQTDELDQPQSTKPTGPTDHLESVNYWRDLYSDAIRVGQDAVSAVRRLHRPRGYGWTVCIEDRQHWPCDTIKAIEAAMAGSETPHAG